MGYSPLHTQRLFGTKSLIDSTTVFYKLKKDEKSVKRGFLWVSMGDSPIYYVNILVAIVYKNGF
jgi:hypothetical protein